MSKTPFEIRMNLLEMAKDLAMQDFYTKKDMAMEEWKRKSEIDRTIPAPQLGKFPSEDNIIYRAKLLNGFVSNEG